MVIKGRGLADFQEYARLARVGRRAALSPTARADVWQLYEDYSERLAARGILDWRTRFGSRGTWLGIGRPAEATPGSMR